MTGVANQLVIDGEVCGARGGDELAVEDPSTGAVITHVPLGRAVDAEAAIAAARRAADDGPWPRMAPPERAEVLRTLGRLVERHADDFVELLVDELGVPCSMARGIHVDRPMANYWDLVERGSRDLDEPLPAIEAPIPTTQIVAREPRGVVAAIVPWNFPHFLNLWKIAPALVTGNTMVLKPALETPSPALLLGRLALEAGVPAGVLNVVTGGVDVGETMVSDPRVDMITFTGSSGVGRHIGAVAGGGMKRLLLELGGKSALLALPDADVAGIVEAAMRFVVNSGQGCALMTRLVVPETLHDEVVDRLVGIVGRITVGSAHDPATQMGPLVSAAHRARVEGYLAAGRDAGAKVAVGGGRPPIADNGFFVEPTIFTEVDNSMPIAREEIFGPVLCVIRYSGDPDEGVAIANDSEFGLAGAVWSGDVARGIAVARRIRAGKVTVNAYTSSIDGPFGGYKQSGVGRELGRLGLEEYTEVKHLVWGS
jgi:aldehyde dehydrogenase (NAD+)